MSALPFKAVDVSLRPSAPLARGVPARGGQVPVGFAPAPPAAALRCPAEAEGLPGTQPERSSRRPPGTGIRVLLADDHAIVRQSLARLLGGQPGLEVVGLAGDGQQAVDLAVRLEPDVIIMDVSMPRLNGLEATRRVKALLPRVRVIALSMHREEDMAADMRAAGACRYLAKTSPPDELVKAIRECMSQT